MLSHGIKRKSDSVDIDTSSKSAKLDNLCGGWVIGTDLAQVPVVTLTGDYVVDQAILVEPEAESDVSEFFLASSLFEPKKPQLKLQLKKEPVDEEDSSSNQHQQQMMVMEALRFDNFTPYFHENSNQLESDSHVHEVPQQPDQASLAVPDTAAIIADLSDLPSARTGIPDTAAIIDDLAHLPSTKNPFFSSSQSSSYQACASPNDVCGSISVITTSDSNACPTVSEITDFLTTPPPATSISSPFTTVDHTYIKPTVIDNICWSPTPSPSSSVASTIDVRDLLEASPTKNPPKNSRTKNNAASKKSRMTKKEKLTEMEDRAQFLETNNHELKQQIEQLEAATSKMKAWLLQTMSARK